MKIYFAGSIRGGRDDTHIYESLISYLGSIGEVLTEHVGNKKITETGERDCVDTIIFDRDMVWLKSSDVVVAEVSVPSLGVGYEIGIAKKLNKPILCLYRFSNDKQLSAMIKGNKALTCCNYNDLEEAKLYINDFLQNLI